MAKRTNTAKWMEKQKRWQINVQKDGERRSFTSSTPGRAGQREANAKADAWLDDGITRSNTKCSVLLSEYINDLRQRTSKSNYHPLASRIKKWFLPNIGNIKISDLTEQHLQNIINCAYKAGLSKKSLMNIRYIATGFTKFCRKQKCSTLHPEFLTIPNSAPKREKTILQPQHISTLFSSDLTLFRGKVQPDPLIHAYRFQLLTGLRPGELLGLMWSDISGDIIRIKRSVNIYEEITSGKNENAKRTIFLAPSAKAEIEAQRGTSSSLFVFGGILERTYRLRLERYCSYQGIPKVTPYEIRHTFVSMAKSLPEGEVKQIVGHSQSMDTFGVYGHAMQGDLEKISQKIETIFIDILLEKQA